MPEKARICIRQNKKTFKEREAEEAKQITKSLQG
jgi:hypothetical protein